MMKKITLVFIALIFTNLAISAQDKINWISIEKAVELQKTNPKKIMIDMYTVWCGPCKMLDKFTFKNKSVATYVNQNYYAVKFNAQGNDTVVFKEKTFKNPKYNPKKAKTRNSAHQLSQAFGVRSYPTIVFLDEKADMIMPLSGYRKPKDLELFLKLFKSDAYKNITTKEDFEAYQKNFKYEFKD